MGGTCSVFLMITFPFWIYVVRNKQKWYSPKNLMMIFANIIMTITGCASAVVSLLDAIGVIHINK